MNKTVYITTTIPYVNGAPHIGYALEAVQADTLARWHRLQGYDTYLLTGTDENAIKNVETAEKMGLTPQEMVDQLAERYMQLREVLNFSYDQFIRTTSEKHKASSQKMWTLCSHDIYKKSYEGLYCVGCETFYKDQEFPDNICPEHNRKLEITSEVNYFFNLTNYIDKIKKLIESDTIKIYPEFRKNEVLGMLESGLEDFSVSRPIQRTRGWGIPVPGDETQRIYVWFDALINYLSALDFANEGELYKKYWLNNPNRYHVVGKNVIKFHAIYWIGMLLSAGIPLPTRIYVHGFINVEGKKMSKSLGNVVSPFDLVNKYGTDPVRYYFLREIPSLDDGDFSENRFMEVYNADLANGLGNLVSRVAKLCQKHEVTIKTAGYTLPPSFEQGGFSTHLDSFEFSLAIDEIWRELRNLDKEINAYEPWKKSGRELSEHLQNYARRITTIAYYLTIFLPETGKKIEDIFRNIPPTLDPLFPRLNKR